MHIWGCSNDLRTLGREGLVYAVHASAHLAQWTDLKQCQYESDSVVIGGLTRPPSWDRMSPRRSNIPSNRTHFGRCGAMTGARHL